MATERTVRREVREETVDTVPEPVVKEKEIEVREVPVAVPAAPAEPGVTNVNVTPGAPARVPGTGGNASINTPEGTQVNVNS